MHLTTKDAIAIILVTAVAAILTMGVYAIGGAVAFGGVVAVAIGAVLLATIEVYRRSSKVTEYAVERLERAISNQRRQTEALLAIHATLDIRRPLPTSGGWAASPDLLHRVILEVFDLRPQLVVEASSGLSTLVIGHSLRRLGGGRVIALEHDAAHAARSADLIRMHGLEEYATVVHAPLVPVSLGGQRWQWYEITSVPEDQSIDMLVIDGPPGPVERLVRYPALPVLATRLRADAVILVDDADRSDVAAMVGRWREEFTVAVDYLDFEKGGFRIRWIARPDAGGGRE